MSLTAASRATAAIGRGGRPNTPRAASAGIPDGARASRETLADRALALEAVGDAQRAHRVWREEASTDPDGARRHRVFRRLGKHAAERGRFEEAARCLETHLDLVPDDGEAADRLLQARLALAPIEQRAATYAGHVRRFGESAQARILRAVEVEAGRDPDAARAILDALAAQAAGSTPLRQRLAQAYERIGETGRALAILDRMGGVADLRSAKARLRLLQDSPDGKERSIAIARALADSEPRAAAHHALLGRTLKRFGDWDGAAQAFETAIDCDPGEASHWEGALRANAALERDERIAALVSRARALFSQEGLSGLLALARIELAASNAPEAVQAARRASANPALRARALRLLGAALMESGAYAEAWVHLASTLQGADADLVLRRSAARCRAAFAAAGHAAPGVPTFPSALFVRALRAPPARALLQPTNTVVLVTSSLGAGGAERQVALTAAGVSRARAGRGRTVLAGLDLTPGRGRAMMRGLAETEHLTIEDLGHVNEGHVFRSLTAEEPELRETLRLMGAFPRNLSRDILKLYDCFRRNRPSCVHLWQDGVISTGSVAAVLAGVPTIVCSMRNVVAGEDDRRRYRAYLATMYRSLAERPEVRFTANSAAGARDYEAWLGFERGRIRVLRNGVDVAGIRARAPEAARRAVRERLNLAPGALLIGGVFRLAPAKRPHLWLDVVTRVMGADARVHGVIVGDGALRAELAARIEAEGLSGRITLAGRQSPVEPWMAAMDALLLASEVEGLPNVLLEAESLGVPVVTTEAGGSGEALIDGVTGTLVADDAPDTLAAALSTVIRSSRIRHRARVGAPVFIEQRFGIERMIRETLAVFGETDPQAMGLGL